MRTNTNEKAKKKKTRKRKTFKGRKVGCRESKKGICNNTHVEKIYWIFSTFARTHLPSNVFDVVFKSHKMPLFFCQTNTMRRQQKKWNWIAIYYVSNARHKNVTWCQNARAGTLFCFVRFCTSEFHWKPRCVCVCAQGLFTFRKCNFTWQH